VAGVPRQNCTNVGVEQTPNDRESRESRDRRSRPDQRSRRHFDRRLFFASNTAQIRAQCARQVRATSNYFFSARRETMEVYKMPTTSAFSLGVRFDALYLCLPEPQRSRAGSWTQRIPAMGFRLASTYCAHKNDINRAIVRSAPHPSKVFYVDAREVQRKYPDLSDELIGELPDETLDEADSVEAHGDDTERVATELLDESDRRYDGHMKMELYSQIAMMHEEMATMRESHARALAEKNAEIKKLHYDKTSLIHAAARMLIPRKKLAALDEIFETPLTTHDEENDDGIR
jgi:hypothetical protein